MRMETNTHGNTPRDVEIAWAVRSVLQRDTHVPYTEIRTTVTEGRVLLEGTVGTAAQREDAERTVSHLVGVREIVNWIEVVPPATDVDALRHEIEAEIARRWPEAAKQVVVTVFEEGTAVLSGAVPSWWEREAVGGAAQSVPGVKALENQLQIVPVG